MLMLMTKCFRLYHPFINRTPVTEIAKSLLFFNFTMVFTNIGSTSVRNQLIIRNVFGFYSKLFLHSIWSKPEVPRDSMI